MTPEFQVKQTGSFLHVFTAKDEDDVAIDLTGFTITAKAEKVQEILITAGQSFTVAAVDLPNGQFSVALTPTNTSNMGAGFWKFDVKMVSADTLTVYYIENQFLRVLENIT